MIDPVPVDPEALFWKQIEARPGDPIPRLLYADWCDENDRPVMSVVQRWLVATGRITSEEWLSAMWLTEDGVDFAPEEIHRTLPTPLFRAIDGFAPGYVVKYGTGRIVFETVRSAEEALVGAWLRAARGERSGEKWKPDFTPLSVPRRPKRGVLPVVDPSGVKPPDRNTFVGVLLLVVMVFAALCTCSEDQKRRKVRLEIYPFTTAP